MPFQSQAQWRWAFANNKPWAKKWAKNTPRKLTDLPDRSAKAATTGNFSATAGEKIGGNQCRDANGHFVNCDDINAAGPVQQDGYRPPTAQEAGSSMAAYEAATEEAKLIASERKKRARAEMKKRLYGEPDKGGAGKISPAERKRQARAEQKKNESDTHGKVGPGGALGAALSNFADPDNPGMLPNLTAMRLEELGLVEFSSRTGKPYITGEGRAYINAARSGDAFAAREAMQRAQDAGFEKREGAIRQQEMMLQQAQQDAFNQQIEMIEGTPEQRKMQAALDRQARRERAAQPKPSRASRPAPESNRTYGSGKVTVGSPKSTVKEMKTDMNIEIPQEIFTTMLIGQSYADEHAYNHPASRYVMKAINNEKLTIKDVKDIHAWHQSLKEVDGDSDKPTAEWIVYQLLGAQSGFYWVDSVMSSYEMAMSAYKSESPKINRVPSQSASTNAIRGLDIQHAFSRGGSGSMIALGRKIANRKELTDDDIRTMHSYLQRHTGDRTDGWADISDPSVAYINWMIHGGDEGLSWVSEKVDMLRLKREKPSREQYKSRRDQMMGKRPGQGSAATGDYALPAEKRFPITDYGSVTAALNEWTQYRGLSKYEDFKKGLIAVAVRKGLTSALPKAWRKEIPDVEEKERLKHQRGGHDQRSHGRDQGGGGGGSGGTSSGTNPLSPSKSPTPNPVSPRSGSGSATPVNTVRQAAMAMVQANRLSNLNRPGVASDSASLSANRVLNQGGRSSAGSTQLAAYNPPPSPLAGLNWNPSDGTPPPPPGMRSTPQRPTMPRLSREEVNRNRAARGAGPLSEVEYQDMYDKVENAPMTDFDRRMQDMQRRQFRGAPNAASTISQAAQFNQGGRSSAGSTQLAAYNPPPSPLAGLNWNPSDGTPPPPPGMRSTPQRPTMPRLSREEVNRNRAARGAGPLSEVEYQDMYDKVENAPMTDFDRRMQDMQRRQFRGAPNAASTISQAAQSMTLANTGVPQDTTGPRGPQNDAERNDLSGYTFFQQRERQRAENGMRSDPREAQAMRDIETRLGARRDAVLGIARPEDNARVSAENESRAAEMAQAQAEFEMNQRARQARAAFEADHARVMAESEQQIYEDDKRARQGRAETASAWDPTAVNRARQEQVAIDAAYQQKRQADEARVAAENARRAQEMEQAQAEFEADQRRRQERANQNPAADRARQEQEAAAAAQQQQQQAAEARVAAENATRAQQQAQAQAALNADQQRRQAASNVTPARRQQIVSDARMHADAVNRYGASMARGSAQALERYAQELGVSIEELNAMIFGGMAKSTVKAHQGGKDSFSPPAGVRSAAKRGLELRSKFGRGGTSVGIARGRDLSNGKSVSASTIRRMNSFFARHAVDKRPDWSNPSKPSNGYIAHLLWGGDAGRAWASKVSKHLDAKKKEYPSYVFNSNIDIYRHRNDEALKKEQQRHKVEYSIKSRRQRAASTFDSREKATLKGKNKPSNPSLWSKAVAEAKKKYTVYPSAYANGYAAKWYKKNGGTWKTEKDLRDWFAEDWVDISRPKKGGGYEPCGRKTDDMSESDYRKKYPKCVPASRAARMSESEKRSAIERKREDGLPKGGKPSMVSTGKSTIMPSNDDYTNALQVRRKKPSNGAAGVLSTIVNM